MKDVTHISNNYLNQKRQRRVGFLVLVLSVISVVLLNLISYFLVFK